MAETISSPQLRVEKIKVVVHYGFPLIANGNSRLLNPAITSITALPFGDICLTRRPNPSGSQLRQHLQRSCEPRFLVRRRSRRLHFRASEHALQDHRIQGRGLGATLRTFLTESSAIKQGFGTRGAIEHPRVGGSLIELSLRESLDDSGLVPTTVPSASGLARRP